MGKTPADNTSIGTLDEGAKGGRGDRLTLGQIREAHLAGAEGVEAKKGRIVPGVTWLFEAPYRGCFRYLLKERWRDDGELVVEDGDSLPPNVCKHYPTRERSLDPQESLDGYDRLTPGNGHTKWMDGT